MTNEQIVEQIHLGYSVTDNMQLLYEQNIALIKNFIKPYTAYAESDDLMQESYFGLWDAVQHYESSENVLFMTYARYWIRQSVQLYVENCGSLVRIPNNLKQNMVRYKHALARLTQTLGAVPTDSDIAADMGVPISTVQRIKTYIYSISSLDIPVNEDYETTVGDTIQADLDIENDIVDKIYEEHSKNELWGIVERYTSTSASNVITERYKNNKTYRQIADERGITANRVRQIEYDTLRKLRRGDARRELMDKFEVIDSGMYRNGVGKFKEHDFTSTVEYIAMRRAEADKQVQELIDKYRSQNAINQNKSF